MNKEEFREWHERRLIECGYPVDIVIELRNSRERWLAAYK